jgi:predicted GNAT family acetyltransferase
MIRPLTEADRAAVHALLMRAPAFNLYILGNLETLGFTHDFCEFWGDWGEDGLLRAVLNRYMTGWSVYGAADAAWADVAHLLDTHQAVERLQDNPGGVPSLLPYLSRYHGAQVHAEELMDLHAHAFHPQAPADGVVVRRASLDDLAALTDFYADAGHMTRRPAAVERPLRDTRVWIAVRDGIIVAAALTNAETRELAMIGGVYTPPTERGHGYSQAVCSALCQDLLDAHKRPVLYWDTPAAGAVYRKLGFHPIGQWRSVWLEKKA